MSADARALLEQLRALPLQQPLRILNVCGGHERSITQAGLRSVLPATIELIPGPGCPVCICPEEDLYLAIQIALHEPVTLMAFGDMLRVPVNVGKQQPASLSAAQAHGADVRPVASPAEVLAQARAQPDKTVVFFVAGFETTCAPVAAMLQAPLPANLKLLISGRLTWPAVALLLADPNPGFDALIAPGHVATVMGAEQWRFVVTQHHLPAAVAGFSAQSLLAGFYAVAKQWLAGAPTLVNCYPEVVSAHGNRNAQAMLEHCFQVVDAPWRGIGVIPASGYDLQPRFDAHNARLHYADYQAQSRRHIGTMPPGCDCAKVVLGKIRPTDCRLYGGLCRPEHPVGPCMVSDEGACRIWWADAARRDAH
ncbi:MAG: hydrogenase formation protein HypD [Methylococcales bacterium]|nr:hydrogenase formation protein HypD [Methylococcales bacterium]